MHIIFWVTASWKLLLFFQVVFFTNSGTEANELALMIARLYTGCHDIISLRNGYHGNASGTMGATAQSNWKFNVVQVGACFVSGTHKVLPVIITCKATEVLYLLAGPLFLRHYI
jgi:acetylornithine/succinyldiaminopimelate/putrescine aminotransferase